MKNVKDSNYEIIIVPENTTQGFNARKFTFTIEAEDVNGHKEVKTGDFQIFKVN
jgi:hypothetical protein